MSHNSEYKPLWVDKIDVATRQIRTAIRLLFEETDPIVVHTIVAATHQVLCDLSRQKGLKSAVKPPGYNKKLNIAENFFKHADQDPSGRINVEPLPELTAMLLFDSVVMMQGISNKLPMEAKIYWSWYMVNHEEDFVGAGSAIDSIIKDGREMQTMSFKELRQLLRFQQVMNTDEPLPVWAELG